MKLKRIISTALAAIMIFSALVAVLPINAFAAYSESSATAGANLPEGSPSSAELNTEELEAYIDEYLKYNFATAAEMLASEIAAGYLYYVNSQGNDYTLYINKYTGFVYYVNNITGQILTSNPINPGYANLGNTDRDALMSQIYVRFEETANTDNKFDYYSSEWAASRAQISVSSIKNGLRVNYTLGDTTARFLLPGRLTAVAFEENILIPILNGYTELLEEYCGDLLDDDLRFFDNDEYIQYEYDCINTASGKAKGVRYYLSETQKAYRSVLKSTTTERKKLDEYHGHIMQLLGAYTLNAPAKYIDDDRNQDKLQEMYDNYPITEDGTPIYVYAGSQMSETKNSYANIIKKYCPSYTFSMMFAQEKECDYVDKSAQKPVIRCALEYTFNDDGTLNATLPASSITFDESVYTFKTITPLQYFGCGDMTKEGYMFYPDGSGTIIEFDDFYNESANKKPQLSLSSSVYGNDFAYANIVGAHREQITMPVYGLVNEVAANPETTAITSKSTVTNGYFAIIEEGAALANLNYTSGGAKHKFASVFAAYTLRPSDDYDLSERLSAGASGIYTMVSDAKYTGAYKTRYVMLNDESLGNTVYGTGNHYKADYVGMASYYRNYLKDAGILEALETVSEDLPLYIELLGSMDITAKFLSFPITKTIPLTTFDNVSEIYAQLSSCEEYVVSRIDEFKKLAAEETDEAQKYHYDQLITKYTALVGNIKNISNINFKLTGFANGGMSSTYPVKLRWERACGGKSGFKALVKEANSVSETEGKNFSIFPEFDFMYINKVAMFDGISNKGNVSKMVDNRYASMQTYDSVMQEFDTTFTLVINPGALETLYGKFVNKYSKYDVKGISVSTIGSNLNSNFDEDEPLNRVDAEYAVSALLDKMANDNGYDVMMDKGNVYALKYATHILNASIDSSHLRYSSYTIPFSGLILHSYVNYTGTPLNYSGSAEYDMLRAIESGASLYYVVCYQNAAHLKDDEKLNSYFGVDYSNWYDSIVKSYTSLNEAIGDLQGHEIVDHKILIAERVIEEKESAANFEKLQQEALKHLDAQLLEAVNNALAAIGSDPANIAKRIKLDVTEANRTALMQQFADALNHTVAELDESGFAAAFDAIVAKYEAEYAGAASADDTVTVNFGSISYSTQYKYVTDSVATDKNYIKTDYTSDDGNVTMVTYQKGDSVVKFVLNYNNYPVSVRLSADSAPIVLEGYGYIRIGEVQ